MSDYKRWKLVITGEGDDRPLEWELQHEYQTADEAAREAENLADRLFEETDEDWAVVPIETELTERQHQALRNAARNQMVEDCEQDPGYLRSTCEWLVDKLPVDELVEIIGGDTEHLIEILGFDPDNPQPWGKDQYGETVPYDLVMVVWKDQMTRDEIKEIQAADWYVADGFLSVILVSREAIWSVADVWEEEAVLCAECFGIKPGTLIFKVADSLHRWNPYDGFYHA